MHDEPGTPQYADIHNNGAARGECEKRQRDPNSFVLDRLNNDVEGQQTFAGKAFIRG